MRQLVLCVKIPQFSVWFSPRMHNITQIGVYLTFCRARCFCIFPLTTTPPWLLPSLTSHLWPLRNALKAATKWNRKFWSKRLSIAVNKSSLSKLFCFIFIQIVFFIIVGLDIVVAHGVEVGELPDSGVGELAVGAAQVASTWWVRGRKRETRRRLAGHVRHRS